MKAEFDRNPIDAHPEKVLASFDCEGVPRCNADQTAKDALQGSEQDPRHRDAKLLRRSG